MIVADKLIHFQHVDPGVAIAHCTKGWNTRDWASNGRRVELDAVMAHHTRRWKP